MRGATSCPLYADFRTSFQSTLLMRGATHIPAADIHIKKQISIHAPHARSDIKIGADSSGLRKISIHAPHARSDLPPTTFQASCRFQSTLLMRGATPLVDARLANRGISIHAPHARSDLMTAKNMSLLIFQSTLLMRGATQRASRARYRVINFNPRSSCEERPGERKIGDDVIGISIHAPHARSDEFMKKMTFLEMEFQSTLLMRGATTTIPKYVTAIQFQSTLLMRGATPEGIGGDDGRAISIHAPHARSDSAGQAQNIARTAISIHAPHARSDAAGDCTAQKTGYFNPRSSCEERQRTGPHEAARYAISIHAPHARSDEMMQSRKQMICEFQSTLLMRGATTASTVSNTASQFQSTLLMRGATSSPGLF